MTPPNSISVHDLTFVRYVLIPRAWVRVSEVNELLRVRDTIDAVLVAMRTPKPPSPAPATPDPPGDSPEEG